jgi:hypothetical protein
MKELAEKYDQLSDLQKKPYVDAYTLETTRNSNLTPTQIEKYRKDAKERKKNKSSKFNKNR